MFRAGAKKNGSQWEWAAVLPGTRSCQIGIFWVGLSRFKELEQFPTDAMLQLPGVGRGDLQLFTVVPE